MKYFVTLVILGILMSFAYANEASKEEFKIKRHEKIENRLSQQETVLKKRFEQKRIALDKKHHQRLKRLEKRQNQNKLSEAQYEKAKARLDSWYARETKQLEYEETHAYKRISEKKEKLKPTP